MNCHIITSHETVKTISGFDFMARKEGFVFIVVSTKTHLYLISDILIWMSSSVRNLVMTYNNSFFTDHGKKISGHKICRC